MGDSQESEETPEERKIQRSVDSGLRQIHVTEEEKKYRAENFDNVDLMKDNEKYLVCTRCDSDFRRTIKKGEVVMVHPLLGVLMCDSCCDYYGDGNFSMDSEGEDKYCRWCGDGGTIFVCSKCNFGFCDVCIKKHFGESELEEVEKNDNWTCYFCNPKPLWFLRSLCSLAEEAAKNKRLLLKKKEDRRLKKKRRKKESNESGICGKSSDEGSSSSSLKHIKPRRSLRKVEKIAADESSSSDEDEPENHKNLKKRRSRSRKQPPNEEKAEQSSDTSTTRTRRKRMNVTRDNADDSENKKSQVLEKLKSIWKLTESVLEAGLASSQEKIKHLSKNWKFKTLESLKREHEDLKSCIGVLATSINSTSNSVNAIKDDLTFDTAKNESEIIRRQEMKLKRFAKKFQKQSHDATSADSVGNTSQNELQEEKRSTEDVKKEGKKTGVRSGEGSEGGEKNERGKNVSEGEGKVRDADEDGTCDSGKEGSLVKPLLKVKSFARMLNDNAYDNDKNSGVIDVYDVETDDSENEKQTKEGNKKEESKDNGKEPTKENGKESVSDNAKEKSRASTEDEEIMKKSERESEQEKKSNKDDENIGSGEEKINKKKTTSEIENEKSEDSGKNLNEEENNSSDENENAKETLSGGEERAKSGSEYENEKEKEKEKKNSSNESEKSSEEEPCKRRTRNSVKGQNELKASFEKFKRKRERYLRSTKEPKSDEEKVKKTKILESSESESDAEKNEKLKIRRPKKWILASSDEENSDKEKKVGKGSDEESSDEATAAKNSEVESEKENQNGKSDAVITSGTTSEEEFNTRKRKRIRRKKKGSSGSEEDAGKKKRRKTKEGSSDSSGDEENKKIKGGRKNIKKILKKESLQDETKEALKKEEERKKRLKEKQKLFEELFPEAEGLILDFDPETKEPLVTVHKKLVKKLKPHQVSGVKFMWDNCFESVKKMEEDSGSGCILAHCMGLGKTLQVVTLVHTVMTHDLGVQTVLIVCPLSTVSNWIREFEMWLENIHTEPITLFDLVKYKKPVERRWHLEDWHKNGGVLVVSYDLFRNLTKTLIRQKNKKKKSSKLQMAFQKILLDPGPDLVICDEGHLLKNVDTALSKCMSRLKTARRIILTGTPLQNNLIEYHCMVQFVKPNILGTRKEFCNRFVNPINNGQFEDSTDLDVRIMKRRSHVLHSMLEGCIQRFDYSVLTPFLPEKHEYVLQITLTDTQAKLYLHFIKNLSVKASGCMKAASLFTDYHSLQRIWTHPRTLLMQQQKLEKEEELESDSSGSLKDFVVSSDEETSEPGSYSSDDSKPEVIEPSKATVKSSANDPEVKNIEEEEKHKKWWEEFYEKESYDDIRQSNKLVVLFDLLKYCEEVKDKVLVFSQSLYSLDLIEYFLAKIHSNTDKNSETLCKHKGTWILGSDYFRLDGSTSSETRRVWCKTFNKETNTRGRLFLISTRAGGLGINLYGANRVVIFDASWNPSHDVQSIFRVYRFGQKKPCYIYRFLAEATMEEKVYERQVSKLSLAHRVVDEHQIERHYTMGNLQELYSFEPTPKEQRKIPKLPKDSVFAELLANHKDAIVGYHEHDSLLENKQEEELTEEERKAAWKEYEEEKVQKTFNAEALFQQMLLQQQQGKGTTRFINPVHMGLAMNPNYGNPISFPSDIPLDVLKRGWLVGMVPYPQEPFESFMNRLVMREAFLNVDVAESHSGEGMATGPPSFFKA